jgi:hypothetical protein
MVYNENMKRIVYKWSLENKEKHLEHQRKNTKKYYEANKEKVKINNLARNRLGSEFFIFCRIYNYLLNN